MIRTMKLILAMLIACAGCVAAGAERFDFGSRVGVVDSNGEGRLCLSISNAHLTEGTELSVVLPDRPQRVFKATVEGKADGSCSRNPEAADPGASFYWLKLVGDKRATKQGEPLPAAIAVVGSARPLSIRRGVASGDLDGDGRAEFFRACASSEGNHLTIWTGRPLLGKRVWHAYYYLGYDVVPDCKKKDYQ
jgi:hypothetical protein